jgi:2-polyprenyl-6-methoxyphenol hydroxylase-like FAD-dependent oxidoreductase
MILMALLCMLDFHGRSDVEAALQSYYNQRHKLTERVVNTSWCVRTSFLRL